MRRMAIIAGLLALYAQAAPAQRELDRIAARVGDDILLESELRELAAFQQLVEGHAETREQLLHQLIDQWIIRNEAAVQRFPEPPAIDVERAVTQVAGLFASPQAYRARLEDLALSDAAVHRQMARQLYAIHFLDYRFRPAAQVTRDQVQKYYSDEFVPQARARGQIVPELPAVREQIRELLTQQEITRREEQWLVEARARLQIEIFPEREP